jgi:hypothetical protein
MAPESGSPHPLDTAGLALVRAEETIALVARATPKNAREEIQRLGALAAQKKSLRPAFVYGPAPELANLRRGLERVAHVSRAHGRIGALHAARAEELELEARLVENIGRTSFRKLAAERFRAPLGVLHVRTLDFVERALGEAPSTPASSRLAFDGAGAPSINVPAAGAPSTNIMSCDPVSPASLVNKVARLARELGLSIRVETRPDQLAIAATGHGLVAVRPGVWLTADTASRIALHEVVGHALPRMRSRHAPWALFRAGTAGSVEAEEGRALLVERRAGRLDGARRRELALRHVGALCVQRGADFDETFRELVARGGRGPEAVELAVRVHRGGGLGREIVYLPAYHEVSRAFDEEPALERWFERGRVGLEAARVFAALGDGREPSARAVQSSNSMNTGA